MPAKCDRCEEQGQDLQYAAVETCRLCGRGLCEVHRQQQRGLAGVGCVACRLLLSCSRCTKRARNLCSICRQPLCLLHTLELAGRVTCASCIYGRRHMPQRVKRGKRPKL